MKCAKYVVAALVGAACAVNVNAQEFQTVTPAGLGGSNFIPMAAGSNTFWAWSAPNKAIYQYDPISQSMKPQVIFGAVAPWNLAVGGGSAIQSDEMWAVSGQTWRYDPPTQTLQMISHDPRIQGVIAGPGYNDSCHPYEV